MTKNANLPESSAMRHARYLAETIGPRGSTTPQEAQAAEYAFQVMQEAGLQPVKETFSSARSIWQPYALAAGLALAAELLFWVAGMVGAVLAVVVMVMAIGSVLLEMTFQDNPLRWVLPKGQSQNVWARITPSQVKRRVLLIGHLDTQRTPKLFSSIRWLQIFQWLVPLGLCVMPLSVFLFIVGIFDGWGVWRSLSLLPAVVIWWVMVLVIEADRTPYTAGANDNATGAGMVLSLATRLKRRPLPTTEVVALCSGCEEVGAYGAADFIARHRDELLPAKGKADGPAERAYCITFDGVGGAGTGPCYLSQETFLSSAKADPELLRLAGELAKRRPDLGAYSLSASGAYTESLLAGGAGLRVLSFVNLRKKDGLLPHWHQATDIVANLDGLVVQNTEEFVCELLWALDGGPPEPAPAEDETKSEGG